VFKGPSISPRPDGRADTEILLGFLTLTGSLMAAGKLQEVNVGPAAARHVPGPERDQPRDCSDLALALPPHHAASVRRRGHRSCSR